MNYSRRDMLKLGAGALAALGTGAGLRAADNKPKRKIPIGLQLYSVREDCTKDLPGVLKAVGKMGYQGVEFAGYYGRNANELRKLLDENGLRCCGTHTALSTLVGAAFDGTIEFNKTLGNRFLIVPSLPQENVASVKALVDTAKLLTELAEKARPLGMRVGYHAHGGDFKPTEGQIPWEVLFTNAGPAVTMQLDIGNSMDGGGDPIAMLKKFPGRSATIHLKEHGGKKGAVIGEGDVDWKEVFQLCESQGKTRWYIVEQEGYDGTPLDCVKRCLENLRKMGK
ncbi:MAG: sugar phosphate isomerase/epimerase family protein [Pirellulales bacterium]